MGGRSLGIFRSFSVTYERPEISALFPGKRADFHFPPGRRAGGGGWILPKTNRMTEAKWFTRLTFNGQACTMHMTEGLTGALWSNALNICNILQSEVNIYIMKCNAKLDLGVLFGATN